jgi:hypothetical protein
LGKESQDNLAGGVNPTAARSAEYLSAIQVTLFAAFYGLAIARVLKRDIVEHMRNMICIALVLLPAGLASTLGYWFDIDQLTSRSVCLALIDLCLISLIVIDRRRHFAPRPYLITLWAYLMVETGWLALGRPV